MDPPPPPPTPMMSSVRVNKPLAAVNRLLAAIHVALATAAIARRALLLLDLGHHGAAAPIHHAAMLAAELTFLFIWALSQAAMWRPVAREAFPGALRRRGALLPGVDVLVVTADPDKEPTAEVVDTVVSALAMDYPSGRLSVYLSDDAGSPLTLLAARKAYAFSAAWVPFCRKHEVRCPCPGTYFAEDFKDDAWLEERIRLRKMYESLREELLEEEAKAKQSRQSDGPTWIDKADHDAHVEVIGATGDGEDGAAMPALVYVSREKRRTSHHHFKAGALNVLLRVSGLMSNSPYVLVLDCDMKCNSRTSAMEAMCFHLDPDSNQDLAFVQFPQMFHNLSSDDIYANELRPIFSTRWKGLDGLRGPILSGTGFYARRDALYGATPGGAAEMDSGELERRFGRSSHLLDSFRSLHRQYPPTATSSQSQRRLHHAAEAEAELVASCAYEEQTGWGHEVGFLYESVVEDYFTGYRQLFCRGWRSAYCYPAARPAFLGSVPTNLNDVLVQNKRWMSGMLTVGLSFRHCPLLSRASLAVSVLQSMSFAYYALVALSAFPVLCYAVLPPLCFFRGGAPLFPGCWWFAAAFASSSLQHLVEVSVAKRRLAVRTWWNEQRFWMLNAVTGQLFACITVVLDIIGAGGRIDFELTSKASDDRLYQDGVFDFTGCSTLLLPATTLTVLNVAALVGGTWRMMTTTAGELLPHLFLTCYVAALSYPLLEGMFLRQDAARVPARITALSVALAAAMLAMFGF